MPDKPQIANRERRTHIRLPSNTKVQASVVANGHDGPVKSSQAETINVSGAGMALLSDEAVEPGTHLSISTGQDAVVDPENNRIVVEVLDCLSLGTGEYVLRCKRVEGQIPADLILDW